MKYLFFSFMIAGVTLLSACSPGNGDFHWRRLGTSTTTGDAVGVPDEPQVPTPVDPSTQAKWARPVQISNGGGLLKSTDGSRLSARISIGGISMSGSGGQLSLRNSVVEN